PPVGGEGGRDEAQHEEADDQPVDTRERQPVPPRETQQRCRRRAEVEHELLRHEVTIEVERLVRQRGEHDSDHAELQYDEGGAVSARGSELRSWRHAPGMKATPGAWR